MITLDAAHDIRIEGFEIIHAQGGNYVGAGIRTENSATRIEILNNVIRNNLSFGIKSVESTNVTIRNNDVSHNGQGIQVNKFGAGTVITDNDVHDNDPDGGEHANEHERPRRYRRRWHRLPANVGPVVASGNRVWGNRAVSFDYTWDGSGFEIFGASGVTIASNTLWNNENVFETGTDSSTQWPCNSNAFTRNVAWAGTTIGRSWGIFLRCGRDMLIAHNTFNDLEGFVFSIGYDSSRFSGVIDDLRIVDNIASMIGTGAKIFGIESTLPGNLQIDYNLARTRHVCHHAGPFDDGPGYVPAMDWVPGTRGYGGTFLRRCTRTRLPPPGWLHGDRRRARRARRERRVGRQRARHRPVRGSAIGDRAASPIGRRCTRAALPDLAVTWLPLAGIVQRVLTCRAADPTWAEEGAIARGGVASPVRLERTQSRDALPLRGVQGRGVSRSQPGWAGTFARPGVR